VNELDSAGSCDEPAHSWRSPKLAGHAGVVGEAMTRQPTWLETERQEGVAQ